MTKLGSKGYPEGQFQGIYLRPISHWHKSKMDEKDPTMRYVEDDKIEAEIKYISENAFKPTDEIKRYADGTILLKWYRNPEDSPTWSGIVLKGD